MNILNQFERFNQFININDSMISAVNQYLLSTSNKHQFEFMTDYRCMRSAFYMFKRTHNDTNDIDYVIILVDHNYDVTIVNDSFKNIEQLSDNIDFNDEDKTAKFMLFLAKE